MKNERIPSELLNELLALASSTRDRARLLKQSLALVCKATGARVAAILTDSGNGLRLSAQRGSDAAHLKALETLLTGASCTETSRPAAELHGPLQDILGCEQVRCIRLIAHHEALGCMLVGAPADAALASFSPELLGTVGRAIGLGIENARLYEQMDQRLRETEVLYRVSVALSSTIDLDALLNLVVRSATETIATVRALIERKVPMYGICLGLQIIALAAGARTYKLPFGHHGGNHPVQDMATGIIEITAQNHNYAVEPSSLEGLPFRVTHWNRYDDTIEGLAHTELPIQCVQHHPEASPGPHDSLHLIAEFCRSLPVASGSRE